MYRARHSEARIQQMLWKISYSDIVFVNTVCGDVVLIQLDDRLKYYNTSVTLFSDVVFS